MVFWVSVFFSSVSSALESGCTPSLTCSCVASLWVQYLLRFTDGSIQAWRGFTLVNWRVR